MTPFQPTHVHKKTGEKFEFSWDSGLNVQMFDKDGEARVFKYDMLTPIQPIEEWEPVMNGYVSTNGILTVKLNDKWVDYPHPDVRLVDGCRLERRKA